MRTSQKAKNMKKEIKEKYKQRYICGKTTKDCPSTSARTQDICRFFIHSSIDIWLCLFTP